MENKRYTVLIEDKQTGYVYEWERENLEADFSYEKNRGDVCILKLFDNPSNSASLLAMSIETLRAVTKRRWKKDNS